MYKKLPEGAWSWAMYDWANSAFSTTVMAGFFPIFFKDYWSLDNDPTQSTFWLGVCVSAASLTIALMAPVLGSIADQWHQKKRFLGIFACAGMIATAGLYFIPKGQWEMAALLYTLASIGFLGGIVFYDSLLSEVSDDQTEDLVSSTGYALGYLGGGLLFLVNVMMVQKPELFGIPSSAVGVQLSFLSVAFWWAIFSIPLFRGVHESAPKTPMKLKEASVLGIRQLVETAQNIKQYKMVALFLCAYWLYIDGVDTIVVMAVDYGRSLGFPVGDLISALLMVQFVGFPFALLFGWLAQNFGAKRFIFLAILIYMGVTFFASNISLQPYNLFGMEVSAFYVLAFMIAMVQGGIQALSRSFYLRLIPADKTAEFFGFYNMIGKFAAIIGPALVGVVTRVSGEHRVAILSIGILFIAGGLLLLFVDETKVTPK